MTLTHDPLAERLSAADDRVRLNHWLPPQAGVVPKIRIGQRWINVLWALPLLFVLLGRRRGRCTGLAASSGRCRISWCATRAFLASAVAVTSGFPAWLRLLHFLNLFFMAFIVRAGVQILADHPRLYWKRDCTPGTEWFRFQKAVPTGRIWTAKDDSVTLPGVAGYPRHPPFDRPCPMVALFDHAAVDDQRHRLLRLCSSRRGQWLRMVPTTWEVFPNAVSTALQYLSLTFPADHSWTRYNSLQQLAYFITVFIAAPTSILTGLMQSPAISNRLGWFGRALNRQRARSIHFLALWWFLLFILAHVTLVFITGARVNLNMMWAGVNDGSWSGFAVFVPAMLCWLRSTWWWASPFTLRHARLVQQIGDVPEPALRCGDPVVGPDEPAHRRDISPLLLAQRDHAEVGRVRPARQEQLRRLPAENRWPGRKARRTLIRRTEGDAEAGTDHHAFLHSGLVGRRQMGRRSDARTSSIW